MLSRETCSLGLHFVTVREIDPPSRNGSGAKRHPHQDRADLAAAGTAIAVVTLSQPAPCELECLKHSSLRRPAARVGRNEISAFVVGMEITFLAAWHIRLDN